MPITGTLRGAGPRVAGWPGASPPCRRSLAGRRPAGRPAARRRLPTPDPGPPTAPDRAAAELAAGLAKKDLTAVEFVGAAGAEVDELYQPLVAGMGPLQPAVTRRRGGSAGQFRDRTLNADLDLPRRSADLGVRTEAPLTEDAGRWKTSWQPNIVQPQLDGTNRLSQRRLDRRTGRAARCGRATRSFELRPVVRIGIDKSAVSGDAAAGRPAGWPGWSTSTPRRTPRRSPRPGSEAFVEAIVFRATAAERPDNDRCSRSRVRWPSRTGRCSRPAATSPDRSSARSARRPRRSSTIPAERSWPGIRSACPDCSSDTTSSCAGHPESRSGWSPRNRPAPRPARPRRRRRRRPRRRSRSRSSRPSRWPESR